MAQEHVNPAITAPTFIDLFSGGGGFTLGMLRAGFECKAAVDFNRQAIATLRVQGGARCPQRAFLSLPTYTQTSVLGTSRSTFGRTIRRPQKVERVVLNALFRDDRTSPWRPISTEGATH
jgi:hypothetical protein